MVDWNALKVGAGGEVLIKDYSDRKEMYDSPFIILERVYLKNSK